MRNAQQRRITMREQGKQWVRYLTQATAVVGGALAALFGVIFADNDSAVTAAPTQPVTGSTQPTSPPAATAAPSAPDTGADPSTQTTEPTDSSPTLQPPAELPQPTSGGGGHVQSRST